MTPSRPTGRRSVKWVALAVGLVVLALAAVLAGRPPAAQRAVRSPLVGRPAPSIDAVTIDDESFDLDSTRGRWVVVNFFATWCVPCRQEHDDLIRFSESHARLGDASVVGVVYSDSDIAVREYRAKEGGDWPMVSDPKGRVALDFGVARVPESFLIDPSGVVVAKILGGVRDIDLDRLLAEARDPQLAP
ncbi:MAG: TlpA family protein disulfide reductase [Acidimicrobiales bacterium]